MRTETEGHGSHRRVFTSTHRMSHLSRMRARQAAFTRAVTDAKERSPATRVAKRSKTVSSKEPVDHDANVRRYRANELRKHHAQRLASR